ncbi:MAG: Carboxyvinyl-carboxyphosphonate phosphorylmutase, partial [uncultured Frankineae bacterium]
RSRRPRLGPARPAPGAGGPDPRQRVGRRVGPGGRGDPGRPGAGHGEPLHRGDVRLRGRREHPAGAAPRHGEPDRPRGRPAGDDGLRGRVRRRRRHRSARPRGGRRGWQPGGPDEAARRGRRGRRGGAGGRPRDRRRLRPQRPHRRVPARPEGRRPGRAAAGGGPPGLGLPRRRRARGLRARCRRPRRDRGPRRRARRAPAEPDQRARRVPAAARAAVAGGRPRLHRAVHAAGGPDGAAGRGGRAVRRWHPAGGHPQPEL